MRRLYPFTSIILLYLFVIVFAVAANAQDCNKAVPVLKHPGDDLKQAQAVAIAKCESVKQHQGITAYRNAAAACSASTKGAVSYAACMKERNYIVAP